MHASRAEWLRRWVLFLALASTAARAQMPPSNAYRVGNWDGTPLTYADCWGDGHYAYVATYNPNGTNAANVYILDIANPTAPALTATYTPPAPNANRSPQDVVVNDGLMFVSLERSGFTTGAQIVDVRNPASPQLLTNINIPTYGAVHDLFFDNGYLYLSDSRTTRFAVVDLTTYNPDSPPATITTAKWIVTGVGSYFVHDVTVKNGRLYAAAWDSGLRVYNVSNVATQAPTFMGSGAGASTHSSCVTDDGQWVVAAEERTGGGAKLYEIVDDGAIATVTLRYSYTLPTSQSICVHDPRIVGDRVYCSWYQAGLIVLDIDRTAKTLVSAASYDTTALVGSTSTYDGAWGAYPFLGSNRILASDMRTGLWVIGLSGHSDGDGDIDLVDYAALANCLLGSGVAIPAECRFADFNGDADVDLADEAAFSNAFTGP